jgi:hypothetical protein
MVILYMSRRIAWTLALLFFVISFGMYFYPDTTRPIVGAAVSIGGQVTEGLLGATKAVLS